MDQADVSFANDARCTLCGLCAEVCPNGIIRKEEGRIVFAGDRKHLCIKCGQCMCICPKASITADGLSYERDFYELPADTSYERNFYDMIMTRRAIRNFRDTPVPAELLQKIVTAVSLAPPGFPPLKTEIVVVKDPEVIKKGLPYMVELYESLLDGIRKPPAKFFIKKSLGNKRFKLLESHLIPALKVRMPGLKAGTEDTITRNAPAMIIFHADKNAEDSREDIFIAATYAMLAAHSLGLGGSIMDIIPPAIQRKRELRELYGIPDGHDVIASVIIGYPKFKYKRGITRQLKSITWI